LSRRLVLTRLILGLSGLVLIKFVLILAIESSRDLSVPAVFFLGYFSIAAWALILAPILSNWIEHSNWFAEIFNPAAEVA
ncbi:MAG: hypothetical protein K8S54_11965, partial [Spirochaetia bacterium]|nr:hypothetical protein [Spirochaetia bacterium]